MANYLFVYYGSKMVPTKVEQQKSMGVWMKWFEKQGKSLAEMGAPTKPGKLVGAKGAQTITSNPVTGYSIFKADNIDGAVAIAKTSPQIVDGGEIAVYEIMPM